jgi:cyclic pyranopterin phosphate synthase
MVSGDEMRSRLAARYGALVPLARRDPSQPATDYTFADGVGAVGFIDSVSQPFCGACDRVRLTADGRLRNCLFSQEEWDVRPLLGEGPQSAEAIVALVRTCIAAKRAAHGIDASDFSPPERAMFQIGG